MHLSQAQTDGGERSTLAEARGPSSPPGTSLVGLDGGLRALGLALERAAPSRATVLLLGETGTGKEVIAREIHRRSRRPGPFVAVNCSALADGLLESELFGHEPGAFTGAKYRRTGRFEEANGGTLLLDEIGDISAHVQLALLRVLEDAEVRRVGGSCTIPLDLRIIAATHARLEEKILTGEFRQDLYYRLNVVRLHLPPLRERQGDIPALAHHFVTLAGRDLGRELSLTTTAVERLQAYRWPGNVRQLRNVLERACVLAQPSTRIDASDLALDEDEDSAGPRPGPREVLEEVARERADRLIAALREAGGNKTVAARILGVPRTTLTDQLRRLEARGGCH